MPLAPQRCIRRKAFFNFGIDILYFPYHFPCEVTYGLLLESFLRALEPIHATKLRHLALCLPLRPVERSAEKLNDLRTLNYQDRESATDSMHDSMSFFRKLQGLGRRPRNLSLESLILVFNDPMIQGAESIEQHRGVARFFKDVEVRDESSRELWEARRRYCEWLIHKSHEPRGEYPYYNANERNQPSSKWGSFDIETRMRTVERSYTLEGKKNVL